MKSLIKLMLLLALAFASTFLIMKGLGVLTNESVENWIASAYNVSTVLLVLVVVSLLLADLFVAMPTLTICILAGYFLGPMWGFLSSITGLFLAGIAGYLISYKWGHVVLDRIIKGKDEQKDVKSLFADYGFQMILLSRATPILPEVTACLAGITKMPVIRFVSAWLLVSVPYAGIATYSGSISTIDNPKPAILTAIVLTMVFAFGWYVFKKEALNNRSKHA